MPFIGIQDLKTTIDEARASLASRMDQNRDALRIAKLCEAYDYMRQAKIVKRRHMREVLLHDARRAFTEVTSIPKGGKTYGISNDKIRCLVFLGAGEINKFLKNPALMAQNIKEAEEADQEITTDYLFNLEQK